MPNDIDDAVAFCERDSQLPMTKEQREALREGLRRHGAAITAQPNSRLQAVRTHAEDAKVIIWQQT